MPLNFSELVYSPAQATFSWPVTFTPLASQPGEPAFAGRGIYGSVAIDVPTEGGMIFSDDRIVLDILEADFTVLPVQGDTVTIALAVYTPPSAVGTYEIIDSDGNGGGEVTLTLRKIVPTLP